MKLTDLLAALPQFRLLSISDSPPSAGAGFDSSFAQIDIANLTADSRRVEPGSLFVAYRGVNVDGHRFIPAALARGAAAIVAEDDKFVSLAHDETTEHQSPAWISVPDGREALAYLAAAWRHFPARRLRMVGITGTDR